MNAKEMKIKKRVLKRKRSRDQDRKNNQEDRDRRMMISIVLDKKNQRNEDLTGYDFKWHLFGCYYYIFNYDCRVYTLC